MIDAAFFASKTAEKTAEQGDATMQQDSAKLGRIFAGLAIGIVVVLIIFAFVLGRTMGKHGDNTVETEAASVSMQAAETNISTDAVQETQSETLPAETEALTDAPATTQSAETTAARQAAATTANAQTTTQKATTTTQKATTTAAPAKGSYSVTLSGDTGATKLSGAGSYRAGDTVTVSAVVLPGFSFRKWSSSDTNLLADGTKLTYQFRMPAGNVALKCVCDAKIYVNVQAGEGVSSVSGGGMHTPGSSVTVSAVMKDGYDFAGWKSDDGKFSSTQKSYTFTMPNKTVTIKAKGSPRSYKVYIQNGSGISSSSGAGTYKCGQTVSVSASVMQGYEFEQWKGAPNGTSTSRTMTFTMPARDVTLTASATSAKYTVTLVKGHGIASVSGGGSYTPGKPVTITCKVEDGCRFSRWASSDTSTLSDGKSETYTFPMPAKNITLTAKIYDSFTLTVSAGTGISSVSGGGQYKSGSRVTVSCTPSAGYVFSQWTSSKPSVLSGSSSQEYSFSMPSESVKLTAKAEKSEYTVTVNSGTGILSVSGGGTYAPGDSVTISASVAPDYEFAGWVRNGISAGKNPTLTFTMPKGNVTYKATAEKRSSGGEDETEGAVFPW